MQRTASARELYRESAFQREDLARDGVTCLVPRLSFGHETYGHALVQGLVEALQTNLSGRGVGVVHPDLAANRINDAGLGEDYAMMLNAYDKTNLLYRDILRKVGNAVGVRYFTMPVLVNFQEEQSTRINALGLRAAKTASATARFELQIWDAQSGRIVWDGLSDLTVAEELIRERPVSFEEIIQATWTNLIKQIPSETVSHAQAENPA
ncbi:MAG TPA: hypothetical protein VKK81_21715 [Candidatus Binatia bacterium]|nr:hypothetical protein [Candidatus Binatia bacterium]